jgi:hypothetical protein
MKLPKKLCWPTVVVMAMLLTRFFGGGIKTLAIAYLVAVVALALYTLAGILRAPDGADRDRLFLHRFVSPTAVGGALYLLFLTIYVLEG